jgi:hypothetical protein
VEIIAGEVAQIPTFEVRRGAAVSGRVLTPDGTPIEKARVLAFTNPDFKTFVIFGRRSVAEAGGVARTDEEGRFEIRGLAPGEYTVEAKALGHHAVVAARSGVSAGTSDVELTLAPKAWVQLVVVDEETQSPITEFSVVVAPVDESEGLVERAKVLSPAGAFRFAALLSRRYRVEVVAEGYYDAGREVGPVEGGQVLPVTIELLPRK